MNPTDPSSPIATPATSDSGDSRAAVARRLSLAQRILAYRTLLTLALVVLAFDQATKLWIVANVPYDGTHSHGLNADIPIIEGFFYIIHVGNTGAAWSMFSGQSVLLALLAAGTLVAIFLWRHSLGLRSRFTQICFGLLCGGVVGNLLDRLIHKHVIDFLDFHFGNYIYPTFNVADSGICVGVILYLYQSLRAPRQEKDEVTSIK